MKVIASTDEYTIYQRKDARYAVRGADKKPINAEAKVAILLQHELIAAPAQAAPEPVEEDSTDEVAAEEQTADAETEEASDDSAEDSAES